MRYGALSAILVAMVFLEIDVAQFLSAFHVSPNLLVVAVVCFGLLFGVRIGLGAGVVAGLLIDLYFGHFVGMTVLSLGLAGMLAGLIEGKVFKENPFLPPLACALGSVINDLVQMLSMSTLGMSFSFASQFTHSIIPAAIYNGILGLIMYRLLLRQYHHLNPDPRRTVVVRRF